MVTCAQLVFCHTKISQPVVAEIFPVFKPLQVCSRLTEEFQLHLLELSCTEGKVTRCNFVTERFSDLSDSKRDLLSGSTLYILKVDENTLSSLRTEVNDVFRILCNSLECLEHQIEFPDVREIVLAAARTRNLMLIDEIHHLLMRPCVYAFFQLNPVFCRIIFNQFICTETLLTLFTVHQRVTEVSEMSGSNPCLRIHQNRTVYADIVRIFLNKFLPPCFLHIVFQFYAEISVIPCISKSTIDFGSRIYKPPGFGKSYDFVHCFFYHRLLPHILLKLLPLYGNLPAFASTSPFLRPVFLTIRPFFRPGALLKSFPASPATGMYVLCTHLRTALLPFSAAPAHHHSP